MYAKHRLLRVGRWHAARKRRYSRKMVEKEEPLVAMIPNYEHTAVFTISRLGVKTHTNDSLWHLGTNSSMGA